LSFYEEFNKGLESVEAKKLGDEFINDLEIVSNRNEKENIKVSFQPNKVFAPPKTIPNSFDKKYRDDLFNTSEYTIDYQNGYAPI
jgi:hypothetical protein